MAKKIIKKKKPIVANFFDVGGGAQFNLGSQANSAALSNTFNNASQATMNRMNSNMPQQSGSGGNSGGGGGGFNAAGIGEAASGALGLFTKMADELSGKKYKAEAEAVEGSMAERNVSSAEQIKGISSNDAMMAAFSGYRNEKAPQFAKRSVGNRIAGNLMSSAEGAQAGLSVGGPWGALIGGIVGGVTDVVGQIGGHAQQKKAQKRINKAVDVSNKLSQANLAFQTGNVDTAMDKSLAAGYFAHGGGIHIKKANKGKFTASANRAGKSVQGFASHVLANKEDYSPTQVKRANFARNAAKWHHDDGGLLNLYDNGGNLNSVVPNEIQHGGVFSNGIEIIENGGTHETNPFGGVLMGTDEQGVPNLVEEGEVKYSDYIFSDRLTLDSVGAMKHKINKKYIGKTFADVAKYLNEESSERPNDPISKNGLEMNMSRLMSAQEDERAVNEINDVAQAEANTFQYGSFLDGWDEQLNANNRRLQGMGIYARNNQNFDLTPAPREYGQPQSFYEPIQMKSVADIEKSALNKAQNNTTPESKTDWATQAARMAPIIGSGIASASDTLGLTNTYDYTHPDSIRQPDSYRAIGPERISNYMRYTPMDRNYYLNRQQAQTAATRNALADAAGGNRGALMTGLAGVDYAGNVASATLARQAEEFDLNQRMQVENFNRSTNMFNSQAELQAAMANQQAWQREAQMRMGVDITKAQMRTAIDARADAAKSANLTNFYDNLGAWGKERMAMNMINSNPGLYYSIDKNGEIQYKAAYNDLDAEGKRAVQQHANAAKSNKSNKKAHGGKLKTKKMNYGW